MRSVNRYLLPLFLATITGVALVALLHDDAVKTTPVQEAPSPAKLSGNQQADAASPSASESHYRNRIVLKKLSATDIDPATSHQHEITGVAALVQLLGPADQHLRGHLIYDGAEPFSADIDLTWYNASKSNTPRYRLYYGDNPVTEKAMPGDTIAIARYGKSQLLAVIAPHGTKYESELPDFVQSQLATLPPPH